MRYSARTQKRPGRNSWPFSFAWEQCKLSDISEKVIEKNTARAYSETFTNSAESGIISQRDYFDHDISNEENLDGYYIVRNEDFVYNPRISTTAPVGPINRNKLGRTGVISPLYTVFRTTSVNQTFLEYFFKSHYWHSYMMFNGDSGARSDRFSIKDAVFFEMPVPYPPSDEQSKIGDFLTSLDRLITLHQSKCFSVNKNHDQVINQFTTAWEQRKLSSIYKNICNAFVGTATPYYVSQGHFYLESNNVKDGQINRNSEIFINDEFYYRQKDKWLHTNDMVMVQSGHVGHSAVIPENLDKTAAHALIMFTEQIEKTEPYFLNYQYQTLKAIKKISDITKGNTIKHILSSDMQKFVVDITSLDEQKLIARFFQNLDHLITLHQRKSDNFSKSNSLMSKKSFLKNEPFDFDLPNTKLAYTWEQRKLIEVVDVCCGCDYKRLKEGPIPVYGTGGYMLSVNKALSYNEDAIGIGRKGTIDKPYILRSPFWTVDTLFYAIPREKYDLQFVLGLFLKIDWKKKDESTGVPSLSKQTINTTDIVVPGGIEQNKIGSFFQSLDKLITLHQREYLLLEVLLC